MSVESDRVVTAAIEWYRARVNGRYPKLVANNLAAAVEAYLKVPAPAPIPVPLPAVAPLGVPGHWRLEWEDQFATLDTSVWQRGWFPDGPVSGPVNPNEDAPYLDANAFTVTGVSGSTNGTALSLSLTDSGNGGLRGACVTTRGPQGKRFGYGVIEARMWLPRANVGDGSGIANWPALWSNGDDWPFTGEIDIMEGFGTAASYYHGLPYGEGQRIDFGRKAVGGGWHTFSAVRTSLSVSTYFDGELVGNLGFGNSAPIPVDSPHYLIIAHQHGKTLGGPTLIPSTVLVDYVRSFVPA